MASVCGRKNIEQQLLDRTYVQVIKSKNKQSEVQVINKADFKEITEIQDAILAQIEPLVQLNSKFTNIF